MQRYMHETGATEEVFATFAEIQRSYALLNDDALYKRIDGMTARLDAVLQQLNDGQGTAGLLLRDKQLYENMNQTVSEMKSLIAEIKKDPKKYLNVKVSIF